MPDLEPVGGWMSGELERCVKAAGIDVVAGSALAAALDWQAQAPPLEPIPAIWPTDATPDVQAGLALLARPEPAVVVQVGRRERPADTWLVQRDPDADDTFLAVALEAEGGLDLYRTVPREALLDALLAVLARHQDPQISVDDLPAMTRDGLLTLLALGELFDRRFPDPEPDWAPEEDFRFDIADLLPHVTPDAGSMVALAEILWPGGTPIGETELREQLALLGLVGLVGQGPFADDTEVETPPELPDFWLSERLLWIVRCLAWWRGTVQVTTTADDRPRLALLLATWIWQIVSRADTEHLAELQPLTLEETRLALSASLSAPTSAPTARRPRFCRSCGQPLRDGARFCAGCGTTVPS